MKILKHGKPRKEKDLNIEENDLSPYLFETKLEIFKQIILGGITSGMRSIS